ncbi:ATPase [Desulfohalobiaceae bacterium Ax17]|uniref:BCAM0308 family protein n=1 Tax=Desulfovulcanus ferrireducens TaxID=2831190 RepID=UPI00207BBA40|nr:BCAM0308 family protein [Desulfovulcanus ferrireducens]MBT8763215.1 ATPase [Desulfovulcanus ferrireducens]
MNKGRYGRNDKLIKEHRHDVYEENRGPEPSLCTECGALFVNGRWTWKKTGEYTSKMVCPACRRCADNYPAGYIQIKGEFFEGHRDEILNLLRNVEEMEKGEHPLERIMLITNEDDHTLVTTTGVHIARRIGEALSRSYKGDFSFQYGEGEKSIRVYWQR